MTTFEEWYSVHQADCWAILKENGTKEALKEAWQAGWEAAFEEGVKWTLKQDANTLNKLMLTLDEHYDI